MFSLARRISLLAAAVTLFSVPVLFAQDALTSSTVSVVPHVVKYSGALPEAPAAASVVEVRFAMYAAQTGGEALWTETQQVVLDPQSKYSVLLGATAPAGLPQNLFTNGTSRWLGVTLAGQEESPRTLLAASAYSLKASDAETLGGHPASDFALAKAKPDGGVDITQINAGTGITVSGNGTAIVTVGINPTYLDGLAANYAALAGANTFTASQTIDGNLAVSGTFKTPGGANKLAPGGAVDITYANGVYTIGLDAAQGAAFGNGLWAQLAAANTFKAQQTLAPLGTATTAAGFNSNALKFSASAYNTTSSAAETVDFVWQAEPFNNDTASPSGYINLLSSIGTAAPAETGLKIGTAGRITFASGQTFPGVPTDSGNNTFTGNQSINGTDTISGSAAGNSAGSLGQLTVTDSATSSNNAIAISANSGYIGVYGNGNATTGVGVAGSALIGVEGVGSSADSTATAPGTGVGVGGVGAIGVYGATSYTGTDLYGVGVEGVVPSGYTSPNGAFAVLGSDDSTVGYYGTVGTSTAGIGMIGQTSAAGGYGVEGNNFATSGDGVYGSGGSAGVYGASNTGQGVYGATAATGGPAGIYGNSSATTVGSDNFPGIGISGNASGPSSWGVYGSSTGAAGVGIYGNGGGSGASIGVYGQGPVGVSGYSGTGNGVDGYTTATGDSGVFGNATNGNGVYGRTSSASATSYGTYGGNTNTTNASDGVHGINASSSGFGVHGINVGTSGVGSSLVGPFGAGVWGDTSKNSDNAYGGVLGTADDTSAGDFVNNSGVAPALFAFNRGSGGTGTEVPIMTAVGNNGACDINSGGDVTCSGRLETAVPLGGSARQVEVYSVQSPENWFEDFGSAKLADGRVTVALDPQFAAIVNASVEFHVFLTPQGECEGLYVANKSAGGFEVRELHHGSSSVAFDYRIVAKRRGHENERLADATAEMHGMTARRDQLAQRMASGVARKPEPESVMAQAPPPVTPSAGPHIAEPPAPRAPRILPQRPVKAGILLNGPHPSQDNAKTKQN